MTVSLSLGVETKQQEELPVIFKKQFEWPWNLAVMAGVALFLVLLMVALVALAAFLVLKVPTLSIFVLSATFFFGLVKVN